MTGLRRGLQLGVSAAAAALALCVAAIGVDTLVSWIGTRRSGAPSPGEYLAAGAVAWAP